MSPVQNAALTGGVVGTALGAGTGAIIGAVISRGDIGKSALLGAAIGAPIVAGANAMYKSYKQDKQLNENQKIIDSTQEEITRSEKDISDLRRGINNDSHLIEVDDSRQEYLYSGPSLGSVR